MSGRYPPTLSRSLPPASSATDTAASPCPLPWRARRRKGRPSRICAARLRRACAESLLIAKLDRSIDPPWRIFRSKIGNAAFGGKARAGKTHARARLAQQIAENFVRFDKRFNNHAGSLLARLPPIGRMRPYARQRRRISLARDTGSPARKTLRRILRLAPDQCPTPASAVHFPKGGIIENVAELNELSQCGLCPVFPAKFASSRRSKILAQIAKDETFAAGEFLFLQDDAIDSFYIVCTRWPEALSIWPARDAKRSYASLRAA